MSVRALLAVVKRLSRDTVTLPGGRSAWAAAFTVVWRRTNP